MNKGYFVHFLKISVVSYFSSQTHPDTS